MRTKVHCVGCGSNFTVIGDEPQFCCYCQEEIVLDFENEEDYLNDEEDFDDL